MSGDIVTLPCRQRSTTQGIDAHDTRIALRRQDGEGQAPTSATATLSLSGGDETRRAHTRAERLPPTRIACCDRHFSIETLRRLLRFMRRFAGEE
jgi:hypothetical protein